MTLKDKLSRLTYLRACALLGPTGASLIREGGSFEIDIPTQVRLDTKRMRAQVDGASVSLSLDPGARHQLRTSCSRCNAACAHVGAVFSLVLEEKMALGLAAPPAEDVPFEHLSEEDLVKRALAERGERARTERMRIALGGRATPWTDHIVTSGASGKSYRVALRGWQRGESYCSCPDFRTNTLGTCKHILFALEQVKRKFPAKVWQKPYRRTHISVHLAYGTETELRMLLPDLVPAEVEAIARPVTGSPITDIPGLLSRIEKLERRGHPVTIYPDAEEYMRQSLRYERLRKTTSSIRQDPRSHALRRELLAVELLPYQLDGIAFSVEVGRAILADDMGLGKTIQGIGMAELLARLEEIERVLVVTPASLKAQWLAEIRRCTSRGARVVLGTMEERTSQYRDGSFFSICNYEQVLRDITAIEQVPWDLIILDEGQRIKNWESKTARVIKGLRSPYALVLSGTPLENRLDELYSVVQFIDGRRLGPAFAFFHRHRVVTDTGRLVGYKNLDDLRRRLKPVLLRRTRASVMRDLPPRTTEIRRITPTQEQREIHDAHKRIAATILSRKHLTEMDLLRLQKMLLICRMSADSTFLVDHQPPGYSSKLVELEGLLESLLAESGRKIILFTEWTTMLDLVEPLAARLKAGAVRLDGSVPQKQRQGLVHHFMNENDCRLFLTTNAGATGLNLQAANTVVNVDLPWNPALLEQRISRAHRMGQRRPVQVYLMVTEETIEDSLLATLSMKKDMALAVLDPESTVREMAMIGSVEEMKRRLEVLLGEPPRAAEDESGRRRLEEERVERRARIESAGGELLGAAFGFIGELLGAESAPAADTALVERFREMLGECVERDPAGGLRMTVRLTDATALERLAGNLAALAGRRAP
jgi:hypothetical protein